MSMNSGKFWLYLAITLVISLLFIFSGTDSISDITNSSYFLSDLVVAIGLSLAVLLYIPAVIQYLEGRHRWQEHFATRLSYHFLAGVIVPAVGVFGVMYFYFFVIYEFEANEVHFFYTEYPFSVLVIIAINIAYSAYFFFQDNRKHEDEMLELKHQLYTLQNVAGNLNDTASKQANNDDEVIPSEKIRTFIAVSGNKNIPIPVEEISCFYKDGNYTQLKTFATKTYLLNHTLDDLLKSLDDQQFFRANRQYVINRKACDYFTNEDNGKLELFLLPKHDQEVIISQKRAAAFREWINK